MNKKSLFKFRSKLPMRSAFMGILSIGLLTTLGSCGSSMESDADKVAKLICEANNDFSKAGEANEKALKIAEKYTGDDKLKFEQLVMQKAKDCLSYGSSISTDNEDSYSGDEENTYESESTSTNNEVSSIDIDDMLDSYEDYVDQYIDYMKKVNKGDMSAMADAPALMEKAQEWGSKMENSKGDMTARQISRMTEIMNKMNIAISDMNKSMR